MYQLIVISKKDFKKAFPLSEGVTTFGRKSDNDIVLQSNKVSKYHCYVRVTQEGVFVEDRGSSNGTFVNGVLVKKKILSEKDHIGIGEYILELRFLIQPLAEKTGQTMQGEGFSENAGSSSVVPEELSDAMPSDFKGKAFWAFERFVLPYFYNLNLKYDWKQLAIAMIGVFLALNVFFSVTPMLNANRDIVLATLGKQARFVAKQIADLNSGVLSKGLESQTTVGAFEKSEDLRVAVLVDMSNRILAPPRQKNKYLTGGEEGTTSVLGKKLFQQGRETGFFRVGENDLITAVEPVKIYDTHLGRNAIVAMAVVSIEGSLFLPDWGSLGVVYSKIFILGVLIAAVIFFILYRITLKPLELLNEDLDKALKGEIHQIKLSFKNEHLKPIWDLINAALSRIPKGGEMGESGGGGVSGEELSHSFSQLMEDFKEGIVILDANKTIQFINSIFEEMSGVRADEAIGQEIATVARDQALISFFNDLIDEIDRGNTPSEEFEFSGINYKVKGVAFGQAQPVFVVVFLKPEE